MKKLMIFLVVCVYITAFSVCRVVAYDDEEIVVAHIAEQNRQKILNEQYKASKALDVKLSREEVSLAYYNESNNGDSESAPYIIDSSSDLKLLQERVNSGIEPSGKYYRLDSNIDLSSETEWTGIGFLSITHPFDGHFDGNHKTITVNNNGTIITTGLFYTIKSSGIAVKDLTVKGTVKSSSTTVNGSVTGATAAGIVYELTSGTLENCVFNGTVEAESTAYNSHGSAAGIVAYVQSAGSVKNCFFNGTVRATGGYSTLGAEAGGIVNTQYGTVSSCTTSSGSTVYASGGTSYAGGITAFAMSGNVSITNCISNATISGATYQGGILGRGTSSTVLSGNSYTGANKEVGNGSTSNNSGNNSSSNSNNGNTGNSGGGGCNAGLGWAGFMLGALIILKRKM